MTRPVVCHTVASVLTVLWLNGWGERLRPVRGMPVSRIVVVTLQQRIGYRVWPSWIWQRKRYGTSEIILAIVNDGIAGVPGVLRVYVESVDGKVAWAAAWMPDIPTAAVCGRHLLSSPRGRNGER